VLVAIELGAHSDVLLIAGRHVSKNGKGIVGDSAVDKAVREVPIRLIDNARGERVGPVDAAVSTIAEWIGGVFNRSAEFIGVGFRRVGDGMGPGVGDIGQKPG
jgi:hypothetical protein